VEHIIPRSKGGSETLENLALSCQECNNRKYTSVESLDPLTGERVPLYNPRRDDWETHFVWSADYREIIGLSPIGRATIEKLQLNRASVRNLRRALHEIGIHPTSRQD
jgi:hypothetical protein